MAPVQAIVRERRALFQGMRGIEACSGRRPSRADTFSLNA